MRIVRLSPAVVAAVVLNSACATEAEDCRNTLTCPRDLYACVPAARSAFDGPYPVYLGDKNGAPSCPPQAPVPGDYYAPSAFPGCPTCGCNPPKGTCSLPATATTNTSTCPGVGPGIPSDPPASWDGSCTTANAVTGTMLRSVTTGAMTLTESCEPYEMPTGKDLPLAPTLARTCSAGPPEQCIPGGARVPVLPDATAPQGVWTYCILQNVPQLTPGTLNNCTEEAYPHAYLFSEGMPNDTRGCTKCTCDPPANSMCSSYVSLYSDSACSMMLDMVMVNLSGPVCVDFPSLSSLGSKSATQPVYAPDMNGCTLHGGQQTGDVTPNMPYLLCCKD